MSDLRVALLGGGSWGTTVAHLVAKNNDVRLWARDKATVAEINKQHTNEKYLPDATLSQRVKAYSKIKRVTRDADVLVVGVPSNAFRSVLEDVKPHLRAMGAYY